MRRRGEAPSEWEHLAEAWRGEIRHDPIFDSDVLPLLEAVLPPRRGPWLEIGCGEGRVMRSLGPRVFGCDIAADLLRTAMADAPVVRCRLPDLSWVRSGALAGACAVLVLEHLDDLGAVFAELHRAVAPEGALVVVANHPAFTAEGAGPIVDLADGELLWRWGPYLSEGVVRTRMGDDTVGFHHRPLGRLLSEAAGAGWALEQMEERALSPEAIAQEPGYAGQDQLPRLLGVRWRRARR